MSFKLMALVLALVALPVHLILLAMSKKVKMYTVSYVELNFDLGQLGLRTAILALFADFDDHHEHFKRVVNKEHVVKHICRHCLR